LILQWISHKVLCPSSVVHIFSRWKLMYQGSFQNKPLFKQVWMVLPKYVYWKIWIACNKTLFFEIKTHPKSVVGKVISLLSEYLNSLHLSPPSPRR
jgi:hypothetical protein